MNLRKIALDIFYKALEAVKPENVLKPYVSDIEGDVYVVSVGKAAWRMAKALKDLIPGNIKGGFVITKKGHSEGKIEGFDVREASHPIPDESSIEATKDLIENLKKLDEGMRVIFLISGGTSSLLELPEDGVRMEDIRRISEELLRKGAEIYELNSVRKKLSKVKGGKLASMFPELRFKAFIVSDVIGDRLDVIGSGPLHPDTGMPDALYVLKKYSIDVPERIQDLLKRKPPEPPGNVEEVIVANLKVACETAKRRGEELGFNSIILSTLFQGEARELGRFLGQVAKEIVTHDRPVRKPCLIVGGGETVVRVTGNGIGGRNQELALSAALEIEGLEGVVIASLGTDGTDGVTDAAGAIVDGKSVERMREKGVDPREYLLRNDSFNALKASGDLVFTGPTGTNVNDLMLVLIS